MRFLQFALLASLLLPAPALAETRSFPLSGFDTVSASALMDVVLKEGPFSVKVEEPHGRFDDLKLEVHGATLIVSRRSTQGVQRQEEAPAYTVMVTAPSIKRIEVSSASRLDGKKLRFKDLDIVLSSAGEIALSGECAVFKLNISSGAKFRGEDLKCETAAIDASSGAHAEAFARRSAEANASTGGQVIFFGKPGDLRKNTSTGGDVRLF